MSPFPNDVPGLNQEVVRIPYSPDKLALFYQGVDFANQHKIAARANLKSFFVKSHAFIPHTHHL